MGWLIALGIVVGLAILPVGASVKYDHEGPQVRLLLGPFSVLLYPGARKKSKAITKKKQKVKSTGTATKQSQKPQGGCVENFVPLVELILEFLYKLRTKIRINTLELKWILAGDDPCDLALNYGRAWVALGNLMPQLERFFIIKKRDLEVECDFLAEESRIYTRLDLTITIGRLLTLASVYGMRVLREYLKIMKLRKGGAQL